MIHICSSRVILNMSITLISMFHILPYMMYLRSIVKILLRVMDLNMAYKTKIALKNTRNSDFLKNREIRFSCYISRSSAPYAPFFALLTSYTILLSITTTSTSPPTRYAPFVNTPAAFVALDLR